jgi:hypothetical protein
VLFVYHVGTVQQRHALRNAICLQKLFWIFVCLVVSVSLLDWQKKKICLQTGFAFRVASFTRRSNNVCRIDCSVQIMEKVAALTTCSRTINTVLRPITATLLNSTHLFHHSVLIGEVVKRILIGSCGSNCKSKITDTCVLLWSTSSCNVDTSIQCSSLTFVVL